MILTEGQSQLRKALGLGSIREVSAERVVVILPEAIPPTQIIKQLKVLLKMKIMTN